MDTCELETTKARERNKYQPLKIQTNTHTCTVRVGMYIRIYSLQVLFIPEVEIAVCIAQFTKIEQKVEMRMPKSTETLHYEVLQSVLHIL